MEEQNRESVVKQLRIQKEHHQKKIEYWQKQKKDIDDNLTKHLNQLGAIERKLEKIEGRNIIITRHAEERYRERIGPAGATEIRQHLLPPEVEIIIRTLGGNAQIPIPGSTIQITVADYKLVTVIDKADSWKSKQQKGRSRGKRSNRTKPIEDENR